MQKLQALGWRVLVLWVWVQGRMTHQAWLTLALVVAMVLLGVQWWFLPVYVVVLVGQAVALLRL